MNYINGYLDSEVGVIIWLVSKTIIPHKVLSLVVMNGRFWRKKRF